MRRDLISYAVWGIVGVFYGTLAIKALILGLDLLIRTYGGY